MHVFVRFAFRVTSLALKFALTIVLARMLGFEAVADYGLALAVSVVSSKLLGLGFSTEMNRRLSAEHPAGAIHDARRLLLLYCLVYVGIAFIVLTVRELGGWDAFRRIPAGVLWGVMLVAFSEHMGFETTSYVFALHRPRLGALLLFIRTGAWAGVAIPGLLTGMVLSVETVFTFWWGANVIVAATAYWCIWCQGREARAQPPVSRNVSGVRSVWVEGLPFFVATTVLSGLQYGERFLASSVISADSLGRYVFSWSIANAIQTIAYATIVVTAGPRLVRALSAPGGDIQASLRNSIRSAAGITIIAAAAVLIAYKPIFRVAREPVGNRELMMLIILLLSFVLRSIADVYWSGAVALRLGKKVAIAIIGLAIVSIPGEWILVTRLGAMGAALAHLMASIGIVAILAVLVTRAGAVPGADAQNGEPVHAT